MQGRRRSRKKDLHRAGWTVAEERIEADRHRLVLRGPDGREETVEGPSRPRVWRKAQLQLVHPGTARFSR